MSKNITNCIGCGAKLQNTDKDSSGYVVSLDQVLCMNCFRLIHYGDSDYHFHPDLLPNFKKDDLIVVVSSILYLDVMLTSEIKRLGDNYQVIYLVNQIDLLPDYLNNEHLINNIHKEFNEFNISYQEIILMSAKNKYDINLLKNYLLEFESKNIYLIGLQNSGKTTIFKALTGNKDAITLPKAALTQSVLKEKLGSKYILDTPGLYQKGFIHEFFSYNEYKKLLPITKFIPRTGFLKANKSIIIAGLFGISLIKGEATWTLLANKNVTYHLASNDKVTNFLNENEIFSLSFEKHTQKDYKLNENAFYQIRIGDIGILEISGNITIRISTHPEFNYTITKSFFKNQNKGVKK